MKRMERVKSVPGLDRLRQDLADQDRDHRRRRHRPLYRRRIQAGSQTSFSRTRSRPAKSSINDIEGLTIENRAACKKPIPDDVLAEIKKYHVTLKGPTTTPRKGDPWPNIESCNVALRKELDLFANVRPVRVPKQGIDWIFFRENTEDLYALGPYGIEVDEDIAIDFRLISAPGADRICRLAFEHAKKNGRKRVTCVTKANVVKTTDGRFLENFYRIAKEYPGSKSMTGTSTS